MHTVGTAGHHAGWPTRLGATLEAAAAVRMLVARLVTGSPSAGWRSGTHG